VYELVITLVASAQSKADAMGRMIDHFEGQDQKFARGFQDVAEVLQVIDHRQWFLTAVLLVFLLVMAWSIFRFERKLDRLDHALTGLLRMQGDKS